MTVLRVAIAGLGIVGSAVFNILSRHPDFQIVAVSARDKSKKRNIDLSGVVWVDNPLDLPSRTDIDVIIELMGGNGDPAYTLVKSALGSGKSVVTANKALLAYHGAELSAIAKQHNAALLFEASVAGGIPIIKMLREGLAANEIKAIYGILNGTCNYILTKMEETEQSFAEVLAEAQTLGYAEADPTLDIDGGDTSHKLSILSALSFENMPDVSSVSVEGIRNVSIDDISVADELGYRIKLIGQAIKDSKGNILQMVSPSFVPKSSPIAHVSGVLNGVLIEGNYVGQSFVSGRGAGANPTASAVMADLIDVSCGKTASPFHEIQNNPAKKLTISDWAGEFYLRLVVKDQPGVIADIAPILRDENISIESLIQRGRSSDQPVNIMIMTHDTIGKNVLAAALKISKLDAVMGRPVIMPVLKI